MRFKFHGWIAEVDVEATKRAYASGGPGASAECGCSECANFAAAREAGYIYPAKVARLLEDMGVDLTRESEVFVESPAHRGSLVYGGWFNIAGELLEGPDEAVEIEQGFELLACPEGAVVDDAFGEVPVFRIEFLALAPVMDALRRKK